LFYPCPVPRLKSPSASPPSTSSRCFPQGPSILSPCLALGKAFPQFFWGSGGSAPFFTSLLFPLLGLWCRWCHLVWLRCLDYPLLPLIHSLRPLVFTPQAKRPPRLFVSFEVFGRILDSGCGCHRPVDFVCGCACPRRRASLLSKGTFFLAHPSSSGVKVISFFSFRAVFYCAPPCFVAVVPFSLARRSGTRFFFFDSSPSSPLCAFAFPLWHPFPGCSFVSGHINPQILPHTQLATPLLRKHRGSLTLSPDLWRLACFFFQWHSVLSGFPNVKVVFVARLMVPSPHRARSLPSLPSYGIVCFFL